MAKIQFYEKPGCVNGEKQKKVLLEAGNELNSTNILEHPWSREELLKFVVGKNPSTMMNYTAPAIKNGEISPEDLTFDEAIDLMVENPILIKRPLVVVDGKYIQGFTDEQLLPYVGGEDQSKKDWKCPKL